MRRYCRKLAVCATLPAAVLAAAGQAAAQEAGSVPLACRADYRKLCSGVQPGGGAIRDCLREHAAALSAECRQAVAAFRKETKGAAADSERDEDAGAGAVSLPPGAAVDRSVAYGPSPAQRMDVYRPAAARGAPVLFTVHGGAWVVGDKANANVVVNKVPHWLPRGYIFVSVNYRMLPQADPLEQAEDVARALAAAQAKARSWGGDPARFVLMGHSAGAHLVALIAADPAIAARHGARPWLGTIALDSAAFDVAAIMRAPHPPLYDHAFGQDPQFWRRASPIHRLAAAPFPMLLVCSSRRSAPCPQAHAFADKARAKGARATVLAVAMTHAEINRDLGLPGRYTAAVDAFLRSLGLP